MPLPVVVEAGVLVGVILLKWCSGGSDLIAGASRDVCPRYGRGSSRDVFE